jgi:hypothetical protein
MSAAVRCQRSALRQALALIDHYIDDYIAPTRLKPTALEHDSRVQNPDSKLYSGAIKHRGCMVQFSTVRWHIKNKRAQQSPVGRIMNYEEI